MKSVKCLRMSLQIVKLMVKDLKITNSRRLFVFSCKPNFEKNNTFWVVLANCHCVSGHTQVKGHTGRITGSNLKQDGSNYQQNYFFSGKKWT